MKIEGLLVIAALAGFFNAASASAATTTTTTTTTTTWSDRWKYDNSGATKYLGNEFTLDLFGTYATRDRFGTGGKDNWGGGLGINYFITRYFGIGSDSYLEEWKAPYRVNGSLIARYPIDPIGLAPYAFGGGGREFKFVPQWTAHAGGGLEFRLNPHFGLFADGRRVFADKSWAEPRRRDYTLIRAGLRLGF
jgi:opacity protein-like surface antigen